MSQAPTREAIALLLPTPLNRAVFAILCAQQVYAGKSPEWDRWAADYLSGKDRTAAAAAAAHAATCADAATYATYAAYAAHAATYAATTGVAAYATHAAAAHATAAINAAAYATQEIDFAALVARALAIT